VQRSRAELLCKVYKVLGQFPELLGHLQSMLQTGSPFLKELAMYMFELLAEYHLPKQEVIDNADTFMGLFTSSI